MEEACWLESDRCGLTVLGFRLSLYQPPELEALYKLVPPEPKKTVVLVDDVLTTGAHFVAARNVIRASFPECRVLGIFIARRVPTNPFEDFDAL